MLHSDSLRRSEVCGRRKPPAAAQTDHGSLVEGHQRTGRSERPAASMNLALRPLRMDASSRPPPGDRRTRDGDRAGRSRRSIKGRQNGDATGPLPSDLCHAARMAGTRVVTAADVDRVSETLARAFEDDPVAAWVLGDGTTAPLDRAKRFFAMELRNNLGHGACFVTDPPGGVSIWAPPGKWKTSPRGILRGVAMLCTTVPTRVPKVLRLLSTVEGVHPTEPHHYLAVLGTDPAHRGKGLGFAAMASVLEGADADGTGCYLESSKESNIQYYERAGFRVTEVIEPPAGAPTVWGMWREPAPS